MSTSLKRIPQNIEIDTESTATESEVSDNLSSGSPISNNDSLLKSTSSSTSDDESDEHRKYTLENLGRLLTHLSNKTPLSHFLSDSEEDNGNDNVMKEHATALALTNNEIDRIRDQYNRFKEENQKLKNMNNKLENTIEILNQKIDFLTKEMNPKAQNIAAQELIAKATKSLQDRIRALELENQKLLEEKERNERQTNEMKTDFENMRKEFNKSRDTLNKLHAACENYFARQFPENLSLINFLTSTNERQIELENISNIQNIDKKKQKIKELQSEIEELRNQNDELLSENKTLAFNGRKEKEAFNEKMRETSAEMNRLILTMKQQEHQNATDRQNYENQIKTLRDQLKKQTDELEKSLSSENLQPSELKKLNELQNQLKLALDKFQRAQQGNNQKDKQINSMAEQIKAIENQKAATERRLDKARDENKNLQNKIDSLTRENQQLKLDNRMLEENMKEANSQIGAAKTTFEMSKSTFDQQEDLIQKQTNALERVEKQINSQKNEINKNNQFRIKLLSILAKQNNLIQGYESTIKKMEKENQYQIKNLRQKLAEERDKNEKLLQTHIPNDPMLQTAFFNPDFPKDLCQQIQDIAERDMKLSTKFKSVLSSISKYFNAHKRELLTEFNDEKARLQKSINALSRFVERVNATLPNADISPEIVCRDSSATDDFCALLQKLLNDFIERKNQIDQMNNFTRLMLQKLQTDDYATADQKLGTLIHNLKVAKVKVDKHKAKCDSLANEIKMKEEEIDKLRGDINREVEENKERIEAALADKEELQDQIHEGQKQIIDLKSQLQSERDNVEHILQSKDFENKAKMQMFKQSYENQIAEQERANETLQQNVDEANQEISLMAQEQKALKAQIVKLEEEIEQKNARLTEMSIERESIKDEMESNNANDREALKQQYETIFDSMKEKNEEQRGIIDKLTKSINESEERYNDLYTVNTQLANERNSLQSQLQTAKDDLERERKLKETQMKALSLTTDIKLQEILDSETLKHQNEMRKLYTFIASIFNQYYDSKESFTFESMKKIIVAVHNDYETVSKELTSVRNLLGVNENESTVDALSVALLSMFVKDK